MNDKLYEIIFWPSRITVRVPYNTTLLNGAIQGEVPLEGPCNGRGTCGKCLVRASGPLSDPTEKELNTLGTRINEGWRLACQARVMGNVEVKLGEEKYFNTVLKGHSKKYPLEPPAREWFGEKQKFYGLAVDIGTTSIVASLIDLNEGNEIGDAGTLNPQTVYGGDVLTRINFAHENMENLVKLQGSVIKGINGLIEELCTRYSIDTSDIYHIVIAANTTMLHLLVGVDPFSIAVAPYSPVFIDFKDIQASEIGIKGAQNAVVTLLPSLSAFVGADILAGVLATGFHKLQVPSLFVDIGTNGEIVANVNGELAATSSAAGPALEGMNISHGCRAEEGAVSEVGVSSGGNLVFETIGGSKMKGICGSGLVDLVAVLVKLDVILKSGRFNDASLLPENLASRLVEYEGQRAFVIDQEGQILLTQGDIRQVQLAKGAIAAAIEILFKRLGIELERVEKLYIAGAFGYHLKPGSLKAIGLIPPGMQAEIEFVGNTAKEGARLCLISKEASEEIKNLQKRMRPLELSYAPEFQENFVEQLGFPE